MENHTPHSEIVGGVLYSVGFLIILTLVISSGYYGDSISSGATELIASAPLLLVGIFMTGLGLKLFLSPERREHELGVLANTA